MVCNLIKRLLFFTFCFRLLAIEGSNPLLRTVITSLLFEVWFTTDSFSYYGVPYRLGSHNAVSGSTLRRKCIYYYGCTQTKKYCTNFQNQIVEYFIKIKPTKWRLKKGAHVFWSPNYVCLLLICQAFKLQDKISRIYRTFLVVSSLIFRKKNVEKCNT